MPVLSTLVESIPRNTTHVLASLPRAVLESSSGSQCDTLSQCRTIWNIVWSCLITIFACIWVAIHPNVPQPRASFEGLEFGANPEGNMTWAKWAGFRWHCAGVQLLDILQRQIPQIASSLADKLFIAVLALLAPEFIFVWALRQWLRAQSLADECRKANAKSDDSGIRKELWEQRGLFCDLNDLGYNRRTAKQDIIHSNLRVRLRRRGITFPTQDATRLSRPVSPRVSSDHDAAPGANEESGHRMDADNTESSDAKPVTVLVALNPLSNADEAQGDSQGARTGHVVEEAEAEEAGEPVEPAYSKTSEPWTKNLPCHPLSVHMFQSDWTTTHGFFIIMAASTCMTVKTLL